MDIFIFTYEKDAALLPLCISHAARHGRVVLVDEAAAPATDEAGALAMGATEYVRTTFDRQGNLNGAPCVRGMLEVYRDHGQDEWVMQVDSNLLLFRPDLLLHECERYDMIGQAAGWSDAYRNFTPVLYASGGGMLLRRRMIPRMLTLMDKPDIVARIESGKGFSDHVLTILCRMSGGATKLLAHEGAALREGVFCRVAWHKFEGGCNDMCTSAAAVHIYPKAAPGNTPEERTAAVLAAMQQHADTWAPQPNSEQGEE